LKIRLILLLCLGALLVPASADASDESVTLSMQAEAAEGNLFREAPRAVRASLDIGVTVPPSATVVTPMINSRVKFPKDMTFHPDPKKTPVCTKVNPQASLGSGVTAMVDLCPRSVIGTGTARIHLARSALIPPLDDPRLVIFNAGTTAQGRPKITIYGFSKATGAGVLMSGFLARNGELDIAIGVLPFDSAIADFMLGIPGDPLEIEDDAAPGGIRVVRGQDPAYLRAVCSSGAWKATGRFRFATRNDSTGELTSEPVEIESNPFSLPCSGLKGRGRLGALRVIGRPKFRRGKGQTVRVAISNVGTASLNKVTVRITGGGTGRKVLGRVPPETSRTVPVKVRFPRTGNPKRRKLRVTVSGGGASRSRTIAISRKG